MAELGMGMYCTEMAGWSARWEMRRHSIRIIEVSHLGDMTVLVSSSEGVVAPDLAQMRERFPELSRLWDAVRHEYWAAIVGVSAAAFTRRADAMNGDWSPHLPAPTTASTERLMARARRAGYVLQRSPVWPWDWSLFDADDGMPLYSAPDLELIGRWLDE